LPRSIFPAHTYLHYQAAVPNPVIDCIWSFAMCTQATGLPVTSVPAMNTGTMSRLRRIGDWEEDGTVASEFEFVLWSNHFLSPSLSHAAGTGQTARQSQNRRIARLCVFV
jgi:hypothetical protein